MTTGYLNRLLAHGVFARAVGFLRKRPAPCPPAVPLEAATLSVVIPVKNAGEELRPLLSMLSRQLGPRRVEIVVVDSGSEDVTLDIARNFGAEIVHVPATEFSHSGARNLGADHASGEYLLFTVQDALPPSVSWLLELFEPFRRHGVVAASCGESPRPDADLFYRAISRYHLRFLDVDTRDRILEGPLPADPVASRKNAQLSDTACLIRKDVFSRYRFRGDYGEDLDLGLRLVRDGYRLAVVGSTSVIHSHNRPAYYHLKRGYVDQLALMRILPDHPATVVPALPLLRDVLASRADLDGIVAGRLSEVPIPCASRTFHEAVSTALGDVTRRANHAAVDRRNGNSDQSCAIFLDDVRRLVESTTDEPIGRRSAVEAVRAFTEVVLDYLDDHYDVVDERLAEELESALYKVWALQCGVLLASSYASGDDGDRVKLRDVDRRLRAGV